MQVEDNLKRKDVFALVVVLKYASIYMIIGVFMGLLIINSVFAVGKVPNDYL
jgi:hypothetical protein